jgi:hypothetical protein
MEQISDGEITRTERANYICHRAGILALWWIIILYVMLRRILSF